MNTSFDLRFIATLPEFLQELAQDRNELSDEYLAFVAKFLLKYKFLDRPIATCDVSPLGRLCLYNLCARFNASNRSDRLRQRYEKYLSNSKILEIRNELAKTQVAHISNTNKQQLYSKKCYNLDVICSSSASNAKLIYHNDDLELINNISDFFKVYEENYEKAFSDDRMHIPQFVENKLMKRTNPSPGKQGPSPKRKR